VTKTAQNGFLLSRASLPAGAAFSTGSLWGCSVAGTTQSEFSSAVAMSLMTVLLGTSSTVATKRGRFSLPAVVPA
jgi:hypothetical protein